MRPRSDLLRFCVTEGSVMIDPAGSGQGRGAYTCRDGRCVTDALKSGRLARTLRAELTKEQQAVLEKQALEYLLTGTASEGYVEAAST